MNPITIQNLSLYESQAIRLLQTETHYAAHIAILLWAYLTNNDRPTLHRSDWLQPPKLSQGHMSWATPQPPATSNEIALLTETQRLNTLDAAYWYTAYTQTQNKTA